MVKQKFCFGGNQSAIEKVTALDDMVKRAGKTDWRKKENTIVFLPKMTRCLV